MEKRRNKKPATDPEEFLRLPGLFRRWELEQVLEPGVDFHLEEAGNTGDGMPLFALYRREQLPLDPFASFTPNPEI